MDDAEISVLAKERIVIIGEGFAAVARAKAKMQGPDLQQCVPGLVDMALQLGRCHASQVNGVPAIEIALDLGQEFVLPMRLHVFAKGRTCFFCALRRGIFFLRIDGQLFRYVDIGVDPAQQG